MPELGGTIGEALLVPHRSYLRLIEPLLETGRIKGMAHITGGGITDNLPRSCPKISKLSSSAARGTSFPSFSGYSAKAMFRTPT